MPCRAIATTSQGAAVMEDDDGGDDIMAEVTTSERRVLNWIHEYLVAGPAGGVRQIMFAAIHTMTSPGNPLEGLELADDDDDAAHAATQARLLFNTLDSYGDEDTVLSDFTDAGAGDDVTSWDILEAAHMPESWDRGPSSDVFKLCLELRTQAVLNHCNTDDGSYTVNAEGWATALRTAFEPLEGSDKVTAKKNGLIAKRRDQLVSHSKPAKKAALKQFAVNHLRADAIEQMHALLPTLAEHFPLSFLEQVDADHSSASGKPAAAAPAAAPAAAAKAAAAPAKTASPKAAAAKGTRSSARKAAQPQPKQQEEEKEQEEEVLEEHEQLADDVESDDPAPSRRRRRGVPPKSAPPARAPAAKPSPALRRSARKPAGGSSGASAETLSASTVAAAGLPSVVVGLKELREGSGLDQSEFLQVWHQEHPEVRNWLDMVEDDDGDEDGTAASVAQTQDMDEEDGDGAADGSQQEALSDSSNRPQQLQDLKAESARLKTLGGDDPLAASLAAGPSVANGFGFAVPASRRNRAATAAGATSGSAGKGKGKGRGRFDRSPIFNKPTANAVKHTWDEDEDEIEDDDEDDEDEEEEEEQAEEDPFAYHADGEAPDPNQSAAAHLESPRSKKLAPLNSRGQQQLPTTRRGRGTAAASLPAAGSASKKRIVPSSSRKAQGASGGGGKSRKRYKRWTDEETENLRQGVDRWGTKWAKILQSYDFNERTGVDLKDRWRNLSKNA